MRSHHSHKMNLLRFGCSIATLSTLALMTNQCSRSVEPRQIHKPAQSNLTVVSATKASVASQDNKKDSFNQTKSHLQENAEKLILDFESRIAAQLQANALLKTNDIVLSLPKYSLSDDDLATLTQATYYCTLLQGSRIITFLLRCGNRTSAYDVIEILRARATTEQPGYLSTYDLEKSRILINWSRTDEADGILQDVLRRNEHLKDTSYGHYFEANIEMAHMRANQGRLDDANQYYSCALKCNLNAETRRIVENERDAYMNCTK